MRIWQTTILALAGAMFAPASEAARIANGPINLPGANISLTGNVATGAENTNNTALNLVTLNLSVKELMSPQTFNLALQNAGAFTQTLYRVTVNLKNNTTNPHVVSGFDMQVQASGGGGIWFSSLPAGAENVVSNDFYVDPGFRISGTPTIANNTYRFGGLNGSGGEVLPGGVDTGTVSFDLLVGSVVAGGNGNLAFTFTANPEPASLLLGSLVMVPAGVLIRRRRQAAAEAVA